jgi:hypothetical protein
MIINSRIGKVSMTQDQLLKLVEDYFSKMSNEELIKEIKKIEKQYNKQKYCICKGRKEVLNNKDCWKCSKPFKPKRK